MVLQMRILVCLLLLLGAIPTEAELRVPTKWLEVDSLEAIQDSVPPAAPVLILMSVHRGWTFQKISLSDSTYTGDVASDTGGLSFSVTMTQDDRTPESDIGYLFVHVSGDLPTGMDLPNKPMCTSRPVRGPTGWKINLSWPDGSDVPQDSLDFKLAIIAVDNGGNKSLPSNPVRVYHDGLARTTIWDYRWRF